MSDFSQTVPELVAWARKNDFSLSLPTERLAFLLAVATGRAPLVTGEDGLLALRTAVSITDQVASSMRKFS